MKFQYQRWTTSIIVLLALLLPSTGVSYADVDSPRIYEVTITNSTSGQPLTPPVVATHRRSLEVFEVGEDASFEVKEIAENGNNGPLLSALGSDKRVYEVLQAGMGPLVPAGTPGAALFSDSVTFTISAEQGAKYLSFVAMLVCTNDGFTGVDGVRLPKRVGDTVTVHTAGYDAGTEINTEDFADIVPPCQGLIGVSSGEARAGASNPALAEDEDISHHLGILGGADLVPGVHGWTNPVAKIEITRIH
ncbi:MAG: spondin domain-containing protein [Chloroflexota bacterium]